MTALGGMKLTRAYESLSGEGCFPADDDLGVDGYLTTQAKRLASLAGVMQSFAKAQMLLRDLCGWTLDEETIRLLTHAVAKSASSSRTSREDATRFGAASGEIEVAIDAGKVNTRGGWRDVSGAVEGAVKQLVNLRLKRTGARWAVGHVGPLVEMIALCETPEWAAFWTAA